VPPSVPPGGWFVVAVPAVVVDFGRGQRLDSPTMERWIATEMEISQAGPAYLRALA